MRTTTTTARDNNIRVLVIMNQSHAVLATDYTDYTDFPCPAGKMLESPQGSGRVYEVSSHYLFTSDFNAVYCERTAARALSDPGTNQRSRTPACRDGLLDWRGRWTI